MPRMKALAEKVEHNKYYDLDEALKLVKEVASAKFDESVDVSVNLGIDARKSDQNVRGATVMPRGTGKTVRVAVFAQGEQADAAKAAGADIIGFEDKLAQLPEKVSIIDYLKGKPMSRCDLKKKKLYDLMQFMAYNSRERLVELFRDCYHDHRDVKPVLDMITRKAGYIKLVGQTLVVVLDWIENKKHRQAAIQF